MDFQQFSNFLLKYSKGRLRTKVLAFLKEVKNKDKVFESNAYIFWLMPKIEQIFFQHLLSIEEVPNSLYRYCSREAFDRILEGKEYLMAPLCSMNDATENYFASDYLKQRIKQEVCDQMLLQSSMEDSASTFITSFSENEDDLLMWWMYGGNGQGVELVQEFEGGHSDFVLAKVSYTDINGENSILNYICKLLQSELNGLRFHLCSWHKWKHFFKSYSFRKEREVRLLISLDPFNEEELQHKWINGKDYYFPILKFPINSENEKYYYPCKTKTVVLGPLFHNKEVNKELLSMRLKDIFNRKVDVELSTIKELKG